VPYIIRQTDTPLWASFKQRAAAEGHSLRWVLEQLIRQYVEHGLDSDRHRQASDDRERTEY